MSFDVNKEIEKIAIERHNQREFIVVVLLVGLALNLVASLIWELTKCWGILSRIILVSSLFFLCFLLAILVIYFRPPPKEKNIYYSTYYFLPLEEGFQIIDRNSLSSSLMLHLFGKYIKWSNDKIDNYPLFKFISDLAPFILIDPLMREFENRWSHGYEWTDEMIVTHDLDGKKRGGISKEQFGSVILDTRDIWLLFSQSLNDKPFFNKNLPELENFFSLPLVFPPNTTINYITENSSKYLLLKNPHMKVRLLGNGVFFGQSDETIIQIDIRFECIISYNLLSKFRRFFKEYYIWGKRIFKGMDDWFKVDPIPKLEKKDFETIMLYVGDNRTKMIYPISGYQDEIKIIPIESRVFFNSKKAAITDGFSIISQKKKKKEETKK